VHRMDDDKQREHAEFMAWFDDHPNFVRARPSGQGVILPAHPSQAAAEQPSQATETGSGRPPRAEGAGDGQGQKAVLSLPRGSPYNELAGARVGAYANPHLRGAWRHPPRSLRWPPAAFVPCRFS
jgi:hypothetical protein